MESSYRLIPQRDSFYVHNTAEKTKRLGSLCSYVTLLIIVVLLGIRCWIQDLKILEMQSTSSNCSSPNAGLQRDSPIAWAGTGHWVDANQTLEDEAWERSDLDFSAGVVALRDQWAIERNVPLSQRWPWDSGKGVYLLSSTHNVHCLKMLRHILLGSYAGRAPHIPIEHTKHCLPLIMQDTLCNADDSLQYTGAIWANAGKTGQRTIAGEGQVRMCRNWTQLRDWAREHNACYSETPDNHLPQTEAYKACPDGSRPWLSQ